MQISSSSMEKSGFKKGDKVVVRAVKTDSLKPGDIIAFMLYRKSSNTFNPSKVNVVKNYGEEVEFKNSFSLMLGFQSKEIKEASKEKSIIIFHKITNVFEDENGDRWFETKGTSNTFKDDFYTHESMILGVYTDNFGSRMILGLLDFLSSKSGLIGCLLLPVILLSIFAINSSIKSLQLAFLEYDVVEEKRKLTDDICVKNNVGFNMSEKTKYKVLAQADEDKKMIYIKLLWKDGDTPNSIRKYYLKKSIILRVNKKYLELNRECEKMFAEGINHTQIAKHYVKVKSEIDKEQEETEKRIKFISKFHEDIMRK